MPLSPRSGWPPGGPGPILRAALPRPLFTPRASGCNALVVEWRAARKLLGSHSAVPSPFASRRITSLPPLLAPCANQPRQSPRIYASGPLWGRECGDVAVLDRFATRSRSQLTGRSLLGTQGRRARCLSSGSGPHSFDQSCQLSFRTGP